MTRALRWVAAGFALAVCWLFACEAWREAQPGWLAGGGIVLGPVLGAAWYAIAAPPDRRAGLIRAAALLAVLIAVDELLDLLSPYPRRFGLAPWEALRAAALAAGIAHVAWRGLPARLRKPALVVCVGSLALALAVPAAMIYCAVDGSRDHTEHADAALVLGFALADDGTPRAQLLGRIDHAVELYQRGIVPRLVLSGGAGKSGHTEASVMRDLALARGVPRDALVLDEAARSTVENFACSRPLLDQLGAHRVLVVTEPWHMTRAMLLARRHGIAAVASPADSEIWDSPRHAAYWLFRDAIAYLRERARDPFAEPGTCAARACEGCRTF